MDFDSSHWRLWYCILLWLRFTLLTCCHYTQKTESVFERLCQHGGNYLFVVLTLSNVESENTLLGVHGGRRQRCARIRRFSGVEIVDFFFLSHVQCFAIGDGTGTHHTALRDAGQPARLRFFFFFRGRSNENPIGWWRSRWFVAVCGGGDDRLSASEVGSVRHHDDDDNDHDDAHYDDTR